MQLHNILITNGPPLSPTDLSKNNSEPESRNIINRLTEYLEVNEIQRGTGINLVLDQTYIRYQYFSFPQISARKIQQVVQFELEDTLLKESENYVFSHSTKTIRDSRTTDAGVYLMEKDLLDELILIFKGFNLELRWVASLENLMDLGFREKMDLGNRIHIEISENERSARFFVYRKGALIGLSSVSTSQNEDGNTDKKTYQCFLDQINQKLNAIRLAETDITDLSISEKPNNPIRIDEQQELVINETYQPASKQVPKEPGETFQEIRLDHPRRINLIKSNILVVQELKKHTRSLVITATIFILGLVLYVAAAAYRGYHDNRYFEALDNRLNQTVEKYLPKGVSKANAIYAIKEKVQNLNQEKEKNKRFKGRRYQVSKTLTDLSQIKEDVPSLTLVGFSMNDQSIRFQGNTSSISDFDRLQEALLQLFPPDTYRITTNEKNRGSESVEFSSTIQLKPTR